MEVISVVKKYIIKDLTGLIQNYYIREDGESALHYGCYLSKEQLIYKERSSGSEWGYQLRKACIIGDKRVVKGMIESLPDFEYKCSHSVKSAFQSASDWGRHSICHLLLNEKYSAYRLIPKETLQHYLNIKRADEHYPVVRRILKNERASIVFALNGWNNLVPWEIWLKNLCRSYFQSRKIRFFLLFMDFPMEIWKEYVAPLCREGHLSVLKKFVRIQGIKAVPSLPQFLNVSPEMAEYILKAIPKLLLKGRKIHKDCEYRWEVVKKQSYKI